jgi:hypothetical protein
MPKIKKKAPRKRAVAKATMITPIPTGTVPTTTGVLNGQGDVLTTPQKKKTKMSHDTTTSNLPALHSPVLALPVSINNAVSPASTTTPATTIIADMTTPADTPMSEVLASPQPILSDRGDMVR